LPPHPVPSSTGGKWGCERRKKKKNRSGKGRGGGEKGGTRSVSEEMSLYFLRKNGHKRKKQGRKGEKQEKNGVKPPPFPHPFPRRDVKKRGKGQRGGGGGGLCNTLAGYIPSTLYQILVSSIQKKKKKKKIRGRRGGSRLLIIPVRVSDQKKKSP